MNKLGCLVALCLVFSACSDDKPAKKESGKFIRYDHPRLFMWPEDRELIRERVFRAPYTGIYAGILGRADYEHNPGEEDVYTGEYEQVNANTAKNNAFIALIRTDPENAGKAIDFLLKMRTDLENNISWDDAHNIAQALNGYISAYDLLKGTDFLSKEDESLIYENLAGLASKFFRLFVKEFPAFLKSTQNNHNIKTAAAIGMAGIVLDKHEEAWDWLGFGMTELRLFIDYGFFHEEGGYHEGPNYLNYALIDVLPFLIAAHRVVVLPAYFEPACEIRFAGQECPEGEMLVDDLLMDPAFMNTMKWDVLIRMPCGLRPTFDDASASAPLSGLLGNFYLDPLYNWDWTAGPRNPYSTVFSNDLSANFMALYNDALPAAPPLEPPTQFFEGAGQIIFRENWGPDSLYFLMLGENGAQRSMGHEHSDPTSFMLFGYGEYLLQDNGYPGYYKRTLTSEPEHHNMILVDGEGPGADVYYAIEGVDGFVQNTIRGESFDYGEVKTGYRDVSFIRGALFAGKRYFIIHDRLSADASHTYSYYLHGYAGEGLGGSFALSGSTAEWANYSGKIRAVAGSSIGEPVFTSHAGDNACYRSLNTHNYIKGDIDGQNMQFLAVLYPVPLSETPADVSVSYPQAGLCVMVIDDGNHLELALANATGGEVTVSETGFQNLSTFAKFIWIALDGDSKLDSFFIQDGGSAEYGASAISGSSD